MFNKNFSFLFFGFVFITTLHAKSLLDCRVITSSAKECNPYGERLHYVKNVVYEKDRQKLIIVKTLPALKKKTYVRVISVKDMIDKYINLEPSVRFKGSDSHIQNMHTHLAMSELKTKKDTNNTNTKNDDTYGVYTVKKGDALFKIAKKLGLKQSEIKKINGLKDVALLRIGQKLKIPLEQKMIDALSSATYTVEDGDTLLSIAKKFNLLAMDIVKFNQIKDATVVQKGKVLNLPLPYVINEIETKQHSDDSIGVGSKLDINAFGTHKLRVTATAYTSHSNQTDDTPFLAAWNNRLRPGMKIIAVSRDLLTKYGMRNGTKVRIDGLRGYYRVRDKMNKRYKKRIDIYMGLDLRRALKWGRRSVMIYW